MSSVALVGSVQAFSRAQWGQIERVDRAVRGHISGGAKGRVPHRKRETIKGAFGVHVTWKLVAGIPSLRQKRVIQELEGCFRAAKSRFGLDLIGYTVMGNHVHLVVGAKSDRSLRQGLQGLGIRLAKTVNRLFRRSGKVFRERFFARALRTRRAVYYALRYALQNARKHGIPIPAGQWDLYSSGRFHRATRGARTNARNARNPLTSRNSLTSHPPAANKTSHLSHLVIHPDYVTNPWLAVALNRLNPTDLPGPRNHP